MNVTRHGPNRQMPIFGGCRQVRLCTGKRRSLAQTSWHPLNVTVDRRRNGRATNGKQDTISPSHSALPQILPSSINSEVTRRGASAIIPKDTVSLDHTERSLVRKSVDNFAARELYI